MWSYSYKSQSRNSHQEEYKLLPTEQLYFEGLSVCASVYCDRWEKDWPGGRIRLFYRRTSESTSRWSPQTRRFLWKSEPALIIGCDANSHHTSWGSININTRGESLPNYFFTNDQCVLNEGDEPTYTIKGRNEVLDVTFCNQRAYPDGMYRMNRLFLIIFTSNSSLRWT